MNVTDRFEKLSVLILGIDPRSPNKDPVWNNGNVLLGTGFSPFIKIFTEAGKVAEWDALLQEYRSRGLHIYRDAPNRHGHSNVRPSYWAMGFQTIEMMISVVSKEEWEEYKKAHVKCCGLKSR
jgi:hypothetical protein